MDYRQNSGSEASYSLQHLLSSPNKSSRSDASSASLGMSELPLRQASRYANADHYRYFDEPSQPRSQPDTIQLPPIRELFRDANIDIDSRPPSTGESEYRPTYSPVAGTSYSPGSNKRRRLSSEEDDDMHREQWQRRSPSLFGQRSFSSTFSPASSTRRESVLSSESRTTSNGSPHLAHSRPLLIGEPVNASPISEPSNSRDFRPTLPHLPFGDRASSDRGVSHVSRGRDLQYSLESRPDHSVHPSAYRHHDPYSPASNSSPSSFAYGYQQPRQTYSHHLSHSQGQTPFTHAQYAGYPNQYSDMNDLSNDSRQRRRRGNLPKHTTDILNAWFLGHLQHAYPTEEEKQMLMQQTGLQMNQISNWFINARRRKLPALQNNARAEETARSRGNSFKASGMDSTDFGDDEKSASSREGSEDDVHPHTHSAAFETYSSPSMWGAQEPKGRGSNLRHMTS
ncbi:homeodomain superfamily [Clarireedia jacksonii]